MHIHKFADLVTFAEIGIGGTLPATEKYRDLFKKFHPNQILTSRIIAPVYEVSYSYITRRGNYRIAKKYVILRTEHEECDMEIEIMFHDWVERENISRPFRRISNVNILEIQPFAYATLSLVS